MFTGPGPCKMIYNKLNGTAICKLSITDSIWPYNLSNNQLPVKQVNWLG